MIKVRVNGQVVSLPTLKGANGKSAYQYAVEAGFEGTEQEFINLLIEGTDAIHNHLIDTSAHNDIREQINSLQLALLDHTSNYVLGSESDIDALFE